MFAGELSYDGLVSCLGRIKDSHLFIKGELNPKINLFAAAASKSEASELGSVIFGAWRSKVQNAKHYGW